MKIMYDYQILWLQKYGGISRYFYEIVHRISEKHKDVIIEVPVLSAKNQYFKDLFSYVELKVSVVERIINEIWTVLKIIFSRLKKEPYEIIHLTFYLPLIWDKFIDRSQTKVVVTVYDMIHEKYMEEDKRLIRNKKKWMEKADGIITISEYTKQDILKIYPQLYEKEIKVIYLGNSLELKPVRVEVPERYVLFIGNREGYKNFLLLIKAFSQMTDYSISLLCVGGGEFSEEETEKIRQLNLEKRVTNLDVNDAQLAYLYQNAICMVFPSVYEGFGIPILEAFYWRCPVLLSDCSCFPEVAGDAAIYFRGNSVDDLYDKLSCIIENIQIREDLIKKGDLQLRNYSWMKTADETYNFYNKLLMKKKEV